MRFIVDGTKNEFVSLILIMRACVRGRREVETDQCQDKHQRVESFP